MKGLMSLLPMLLGRDGESGNGSLTIKMKSGRIRPDEMQGEDENDLPMGLLNSGCCCSEKKSDQPTIDELSDMDLPLALTPRPASRAVGGQSGKHRGLPPRMNEFML